MITVKRGDEYLLHYTGEVMEFAAIENAKSFLKAQGMPPEEIDKLEFTNSVVINLKPRRKDGKI